MLLPTDPLIRCELSDLCTNANIHTEFRMKIANILSHSSSILHAYEPGDNDDDDENKSGAHAGRECVVHTHTTEPKIFDDKWWLLIVLFSFNLRLCIDACVTVSVCFWLVRICAQAHTELIANDSLHLIEWRGIQEEKNDSKQSCVQIIRYPQRNGQKSFTLISNR